MVLYMQWNKPAGWPPIICRKYPLNETGSQQRWNVEKGFALIQFWIRLKKLRKKSFYFQLAFFKMKSTMILIIYSNYNTNREKQSREKKYIVETRSFMNFKQELCLWAALRLLFCWQFPNRLLALRPAHQCRVSSPDVVMPSYNHSCHNAVPRGVCPWGFPYLGIQVTWAYWCLKKKKRAPLNGESLTFLVVLSSSKNTAHN